MKAGFYNIYVGQGKLYDKQFTKTINGSPMDFTGYTAKLEIKDDDGLTVIELSTTPDASGNGINLGGTAGTFEVIMKTALTKTFTFDRGTYQMQLTRPDGEDLPLLYGGVYVTSEFSDL